MLACFRSSLRLAISAAFSSLVIGTAAGACVVLDVPGFPDSVFPQSPASFQSAVATGGGGDCTGVERRLEGAGDAALCTGLDFVAAGGDSVLLVEEAFRVPLLDPFNMLLLVVSLVG